MADDDLTTTVLKAFVLSRDPLKKDACGAMLDKGAATLDRISDDLTRELYGFFSGFFAALAAVGVAEASFYLDRMNQVGRDDPASMRRAIRAGWEVTTA